MGCATGEFEALYEATAALGMTWLFAQNPPIITCCVAGCAYRTSKGACLEVAWQEIPDKDEHSHDLVLCHALHIAAGYLENQFCIQMHALTIRYIIHDM